MPQPNGCWKVVVETNQIITFSEIPRKWFCLVSFCLCFLPRSKNDRKPSVLKAFSMLPRYLGGTRAAKVFKFLSTLIKCGCLTLSWAIRRKIGIPRGETVSRAFLHWGSKSKINRGQIPPVIICRMSMNIMCRYWTIYSNGEWYEKEPFQSEIRVCHDGQDCQPAMFDFRQENSLNLKLTAACTHPNIQCWYQTGIEVLFPFAALKTKKNDV